ncbi:MAG: hypothetical protein ABI266_06365, partial [Ginsengibacter sp.]
RHLRREDEKLVGIDEIAPFMVIEFDRNDKKIILSHSRIWEKVKADEVNAQIKEKRADAETTKKAVKSIQSKVEKTTLGDLGVLAALKQKMDGDNAEPETSSTTGKEEETETVQTPTPPADEPKQIVAKAKKAAKKDEAVDENEEDETSEKEEVATEAKAEETSETTDEVAENKEEASEDNDEAKA